MVFRLAYDESIDPATKLGHSIMCRIAAGPNQGREVLTLQTSRDSDEPSDDRAGKVAGFSLHAGIAATAP